MLQLFHIQAWDLARNKPQCKLTSEFEGVVHLIVYDYDRWFANAQELSLTYDSFFIACRVVNDIRRVYHNGKIYQDYPQWPRGKLPPNFRW